MRECPHGVPIKARRNIKVPLCGAQVWRCCCCTNTVSELHMRRKTGCPKCPDAQVETSKCRKAVLPDLTRCRTHGAGNKQSQQLAKRIREHREAGKELAKIGVPIETTTIEGLEQLIAEANGNVAALRCMVQALPVKADGRGLWEPTFHHTGVETGEAKPHVIVVMYDGERDRFARLLVAGAKLDIDQRRLRLQEGQITRLFEAVTSALEVLTPADQDLFRAALVREIRAGPALRAG